MKRKQKMKTLGLTLLLVFSVILVACGGHDISTLEEALEGHWTVTDARVNGEPLAEVIHDFDQFLDVDPEDVTGADNEVEVELYFYDGILTLESAEGEVSTIPYIVKETNEGTHKLTLEYHVVDEEVDITLNEVLTFNTEDRDSYTSALTIVDISMTPDASAEEVSELEAGMKKIGEDIVREIARSINLELNAVYVDDADAPATTTE